MNKHILSVIYMFLITLFFASLVSAVKLLNDQRIERNQTFKLQKIILRVLKIPVQGQMMGEELARLYTDRVKEIDVRGKTLYVGYGEDGQSVLGYALPVGGPGFWGPIQGMVGISPDATKVLGIAFIKHSETPGLGGRITEPWFTGQFKDLPIYPIKGDQNIFYLKPEGTGQAANDLDAITGATNTSAAVETFLNRDLDHFLKELWGSIEETQ